MHNGLFALTALSPLDGRYSQPLAPLAQFFSEQALIFYRLKVEVEYVLFLSDEGLIPSIAEKDRAFLRTYLTSWDAKQAEQVKQFELETKHDVKAVEYFLADLCRQQGIDIAHWIHIGLTSEDTNSLAQGLMLQAALDEVILPALDELLRTITIMAEQSADQPMLARTHGQPAVPTTVGKELLVFGMRLLNELQAIRQTKITAKLSGAVGTFAAQKLAFPKADWLRLSQIFISSLGLEPALLTAQSVPAETYSHLFSGLLRINYVLIDLNQDCWRYISDGYLMQTASKKQVGSSTMPHKINPIDFENSEGNLGLANSLLGFFIQKLPISRLQRDLSDSTVKRNIGVALGYGLLAYLSLKRGLQQIQPNPSKMERDLLSHWEVVTEALQVTLRARGDATAYEQLRLFAQGKELDQAQLERFIASLSLTDDIKNQLLAITPLTYTGDAARLVHEGISRINSYFQGDA